MDSNCVYCAFLVVMLPPAMGSGLAALMSSLALAWLSYKIASVARFRILIRVCSGHALTIVNDRLVSGCRGGHRAHRLYHRSALSEAIL